MMPLISCIIPTHNGARFLASAIRSLQAQTLRPIEIIVVDDGSTDNSFDVAESCGSPVTAVRINASNPALARSFGITLAKGDYVAFLDQDDVSVPTRLELQYGAFQADRKLDVCVGMVQRFTQSIDGTDMIMLGAPVAGYLTISMLSRREMFEVVGPLNPAQRYSDSAEWFLRARDLGCSVRLLSDVVTYHRDHDANLSLVHGDASRREFIHLIRSRLTAGRSRR